MNLRDADEVLFEINKSAPIDEFTALLKSMPESCNVTFTRGWYFSDNPEHSTRNVPSFSMSGECFVTRLYDNEEIRNKYLSSEESFLGIFDRKAYLAFTSKGLHIDPEEDYIGDWVKVSPDKAKEIINNEDPWTGVTLYPDGSYYTAINADENEETDHENEPIAVASVVSSLISMMVPHEKASIRINLLGECEFFDVMVSKGEDTVSISLGESSTKESHETIRNVMPKLLASKLSNFDGMVRIDFNDEYSLFVSNL